MKSLIPASIITLIFSAQAFAMPSLIRCKSNSSTTAQVVHSFTFTHKFGNITSKSLVMAIDSVPTDPRKVKTRTYESSFKGIEDAEDTNLVHLDPRGFIMFDSALSQVTYLLPDQQRETVITSCKSYRPGGGVGNAF